jgi:nucleotide-binding universal stress UspA family protein
LKTILCAVDFSPAALRAVGLAIQLARPARASVTFLQVVEWLAEEEPREVAHFAVPEYRAYLAQDAHEQLEALIAKLPRIEHGAVVKVAMGRAYREILRVASDVHADLIVMGARGRGGLPLAPLGSTTQQVVRAASCPVLTVPRQEGGPGRELASAAGGR